MKTLLTLICSFALISFVSAAQLDRDQNDNPKGKKEKGAAVVQQQGTGGGAKLNSQGPTTTHAAKLHTQGNARMIHDPTLNQGGGSLSTAKGTTFNKTAKFNKNVTVNKNITVNKNFKVQKFNLSNKPNQKYKVVKFNQNYKIAGSNNWKGSKYQIFVNYHPQWHDQYWWTSHHNHIVFVFGSPYYWDSGYWYPTWGYDPGANYYYDGPIYSSNPEMDPAQMVANVQAALQQQGFYQGEIDGILGPETRAGLAEFQSAQGLEPTGAVDEPTAEALGIA
jgi:hypothetical protein